jgi:hypothetical protein
MSAWLTSVAFFAVCGLILYPVTQLYVAALIYVGRKGGMLRLLGGILLWVAFCVPILLPLVVFLSSDPWGAKALSDGALLVWAIAWYGVLTFLPVGYALARRVRELRDVGFFLPDT